jgi:DNA-binding NarL/FixJ family response regulator
MSEATKRAIMGDIVNGNQRATRYISASDYEDLIRDFVNRLNSLTGAGMKVMITQGNMDKRLNAVNRSHIRSNDATGKSKQGRHELSDDMFRRILELHYNGYSNTKIAEMTGTSRNTVMNKIRKGIELGIIDK